MKSSPTLSYCAHEVRRHDRDHFLQCLFLPIDIRETVLALYAMYGELARIHLLVREETIGQVRLAWWQDSVEALYSKNVRPQPVLQALAPAIAAEHIPKELLLSLIDDFRSSFPEVPTDGHIKLEMIVRHLIETQHPESATAWNKAGEMITKHRSRYGNKLNSLLYVKLLIAGS